ncbi:MAG TPA: hypothetical protein DEO60_13110 [Bacteroidales bacterium]|nr:hypothetical protein [Bacteroidales bacterium]
MNPEENPAQSLAKTLSDIERNGILADRKHLKRNMCTQFADYYEFIREYVVNAYDASATFCLIKVSEEETFLKIGIHDNGNGMDLERLKDFLTVFRSRKDNLIVKSIGRHGIGKLSVAALPGLIHFRTVTSTGSECHEFDTDSLLEDHPIIIKKTRQIQPQGTLFEITLRKDQPAIDLAQKLSDILYTYIRFLPISIRFFVNDKNWPTETSGNSIPKQEWAYPPECYGRSYNIRLNGTPCEIVLGIGQGVHEIYQNRVFISSKYNLFSHGNTESTWIPNLMIRVDSEAFELPFGRHCLCNEGVLTGLTKEIREKIVPAYFDFLTGHFDFKMCAGVPQILEKTDELAIGLLNFGHSGYTWSHYPVFRMVEGERLSMTELNLKIRENNCLYIEAENNEGIDFNHFNAPVLSLEQPAGAKELLESLYPEAIVNLSNEDTVIEMPLNENLKITKEQKRYESYLAFKPGVIDFGRFGLSENRDSDINGFTKSPAMNLSDYTGISEEAGTANRDLLNLAWKVNYLVERDGVTPCMRKKFMFRNNAITLNLYHSEIKEFIQMATLNPNLAAHWTMAMCLADNKILPHISEETREDLLIIDAITRLGHDHRPDQIKDMSSDTDRNFMDFVRNCISRTSGKF